MYSFVRNIQVLNISPYTQCIPPLKKLIDFTLFFKYGVGSTLAASTILNNKTASLEHLLWGGGFLFRSLVPRLPALVARGFAGGHIFLCFALCSLYLPDRIWLQSGCGTTYTFRELCVLAKIDSWISVGYGVTDHLHLQTYSLLFYW